MRRFRLALLRARVEEKLASVHAGRLAAVWRTVEALLVGGRLSLTALAHSLSSETSLKHRIKAIDRLLANEELHGELGCFYAALLHPLFHAFRFQPLIVVDWTEHGRVCVLSAAVVHDSRALPIYNEAHPRSSLGNDAVHRRFLGALKLLLPVDAKPIVVTDAGFQRPWFDEVSKMGWHFIGRIRNTTKYSYDRREWFSTKALYADATAKPRSLGIVHLRRERSAPVRFVLFKKKLKGRVHINKRGERSSRTDVRKCARRAQEPWLLAVSPGLPRNARFVANAYAARFQIEQTFRDTKNARYGWGAKLALSKTPGRVAVLYLIATYARLACELVGIAAERMNLQRHFQANTSRRRVLSRFSLARLVFRELAVPIPALGEAMSELVDNIRSPALAKA